MKSFFENYGFVILSAIVVIILIAMSGPVGHTIENNISNTIGGFSDKTSQRLNQVLIEFQPKDTIYINGKEYIIIEKKSNNNYLVLAPLIDGDPMQFDKNFTAEYNSSYINDYLENTYFNSLPKNLKDAIVAYDIYQDFYAEDIFKMLNLDRFIWDSKEIEYCKGTLCIKNDKGEWQRTEDYDGVSGKSGYVTFDVSPTSSKNIGKHKVFLPSVKELQNIVNVNDEKEMEDFLLVKTNPYHMWLRDKDKGHFLYANYDGRSLLGTDADNKLINVRPAFVIDLSKVNYEVK